MLSVSKNVTDDTLQAYADYLVHWTKSNGMIINTNKTKELIICFSKKVNTNDIPQLCMHGSNIDRVTKFKLLGVFIISDLSWESHVTYMLQKVAKLMYCVIYLVNIGVPVYCTIIHSILEYACHVWHPGLTKNCLKDIERVQKCCLKLLYPYFSYNEALNKSGLDRLDYHRDLITVNLFRQIPKHPLHYLLPPVKVSGGARVYGALVQVSYLAPLQTSNSSETVSVARFVKRGKTACASP